MDMQEKQYVSSSATTTTTTTSYAGQYEYENDNDGMPTSSRRSNAAGERGVHRSEDSGQLMKAGKIALVAIAISAAVFAAIHFTVGFSFVVSLVVANPIKTTILLVVVAGILWAVFHEKTASSKGEEAFSEMQHTQRKNAPSQNDQFLTMLKESTYPLTRLANMTNTTYDGMYNNLQPSSKLEYLMIMGRVNVHEFADLEPTDKKRFCEAYKTKVVDRFLALNQELGNGDARLAPATLAAATMLQDLKWFRLAEMEYIKRKAGNTDTEEYTEKDANQYFKTNANSDMPHFTGHPDLFKVRGKMDFVIA